MYFKTEMYSDVIEYDLDNSPVGHLRITMKIRQLL